MATLEPGDLARLLKSLEDMAKANEELRQQQAQNGNNRQRDSTSSVTGGASLTNIVVRMDMGESAEERLVNFVEWCDEIDDKLAVANVKDDKVKTRVALMWGGHGIKENAVDRAGVKLKATTGENPVQAHTWEQAKKLIQTKMESGLNEAFAMSKFRHRDVYEFGGDFLGGDFSGVIFRG